MTSKMERKFFSGNSIEQAVLAAASHYGLEPSRVAYRLRDKKHGFVNIRRRVVIEVDPEAPERTDEGPIESSVESPSVEPSAAAGPPQSASSRRRPDHQRERLPRNKWRGEQTKWTADGRPDPMSAAFEASIEEVAELLSLDVEAAIEHEGEGVTIELSGPGSELLVRDGGKVLEAIEHLLPRMARGLTGRGAPCRVDCQGFRAAHELQLKRLAEEAADEVRRDLREQVLDPMNPADRRLVHLALADDPAVLTESEGEGFFKRVKIRPAQERRSLFPE